MLLSNELAFIDLVTDTGLVPLRFHDAVLGTKWKVRTEISMIREAQNLLKLGLTKFATCRDIVNRINTIRNSMETPPAPVYLILHDEISGFDSEGGPGGSICINMCTNAGWRASRKLGGNWDQFGPVWRVPILLIIYHELGHYLQYLSNPDYYTTVSKHADEQTHHLLDVMNLPDNEYPLCVELEMGRREYYGDMKDLSSPDFRGHPIAYTRKIPLDKEFALAEKPESVKEQEAREARAKMDLLSAASGIVVASDAEKICSFCKKKFRGKRLRERHEEVECDQRPKP